MQCKKLLIYKNTKMRKTPILRTLDNSKATLHNVFTSKPLPKPPLSPKIPTHQILKDLGFINQPSSGTIHWLPLGLKSLHKLEAIIRRRMNEIGGSEVSLSSLSSKSLWEKTGRWNNTELFKMSINDKNNVPDFCLAPTHEEEITELVKQSNLNYKNLPLLLYQISRKYRFEKRPRGGLLRGREFIMKDAYSFDINAKEAMETYSNIRAAYWKVFEDLKIPFEVAQADSGDIGGNLSEEWHIVSETGEDLIFKCDSCSHVSNVEKTISFPTEDHEDAKFADVKYALSEDRDTLIASYYPQGRNFIPSFLKNVVEDVDLDTLNWKPDELIKSFSHDEDSLLVKKIIRIMDVRLSDSTDLPDFPLTTFQRNNFSMITDVSLVEAQEDEICGQCEEGQLKGTKAIEVGHTFYLGKRYSTPLEAKLATKDNRLELIEMGCYGIGVSRIIASIAEISRDEDGLIWPVAIAPYDISVIESSGVETEAVNKFISSLDSKLDIHRDLRPKCTFGARISYARMIGIPIVVVLGKNYPIAEMEIRGKRWKGEQSYKELYNLKKEEWNWSIVESDKYEKHFVHKDHAPKVINALLNDL